MISPRRPATTIGELDIHLGFIMEEMRGMRAQQEALRVQQEAMMQQLATKQEVAALKEDLDAKISANSAGAWWKRLTEISVGITAFAAAVGVIIAILRYLPKE